MCQVKKLTSSEFTMEDFLSGKKFDYIVYDDRPEFGYHFSKNYLKKGNKIIGEVLPYNDGTFQVNIWLIGRFCVCYLNLQHCKHHKPVGHLIKSIKNRLKITKQ